MKKIIIREEIFTKHYDGIVNGIPFSDLPKDILPTDIIDIGKMEGYYSENNSWDDNSVLVVYRERLETDDELKKRDAEYKELQKELKSRRYENYLKLKKEFEV